MASQRESGLKNRIRKHLEDRDWFVQNIHSNIYTGGGFPDLFVTHADHDYRLIDVKVKGDYSITPAQRIVWPLLDEMYNCGVWILTDPSEYRLLFKPCNYRQYMPKGDLPDVFELLEQLNEMREKRLEAFKETEG